MPKVTPFDEVPMPLPSVRAPLGLLLLLTGALAAADLRPGERAALAAFDQELAGYATARATRAVADHTALLQAARERRAVLRRLVREDPEQALAVALDRVRRRQLPAAVAGEVEQEVSALGALEVRLATS